MRLRMLGWRRCLWSRRRSGRRRFRRRLIVWTCRFGSIIRLRRWRTILRTIRLWLTRWSPVRLSRRRAILRLVRLRAVLRGRRRAIRLRAIRRCRFGPIRRRCLRPIVRRIHCWPIWLRWRRLTRRRGWPIRLSGRSFGGMLIRCRWIARSIRGLVRCRSRLPRPSCLLIRRWRWLSRMCRAWGSTGLTDGCGRRFAGRRNPYRGSCRRGSRRSQRLHFASC